jgi:hypothetical protein
MRTKDSTNDFISLPIDRRGMISVPGMLFYDTARLFLAFSDKNRAFEPSMLNISNGLLETSLFPPLSASASKMPAWEPDTSVLSLNAKNNQAMGKVQAKRMKDAAILENVTVTAKAKTQIEKIESEYVSSMFRGGDGKSFDILNDRSAISSMSIFQYLQGRVAGLQITMNGSTPTASWRGGTPTFYLNEMRTDINEVNTIPMADIAYVKVISPGSAGVISNTGGGVIAIYTRKGGDVVRNDQSSLGVVKLRGYSPVKEFYSPNYASSDNNDHFYDDLRTTLYWNPMILLEKTKKRFKFQFFNNDITSRFRLVMEGINDDGKLVHVEKIISKN